MFFEKINFIIKKIIKSIHNNDILFFLISIPIKFLDILFFRQKNEILFYGYMGRCSGNAFSLYKYYLTQKNYLKPVWLLDDKDISLFEKNNECFPLPNKKSGIIPHLKLLFKIAQAKAVVVSSFGDLHIYCSILYSKKRKEILLPHGTTLKSAGVLSKHLSFKQKKVWSSQSKRFDLISVSSRVEQYWTSASLNLHPNKIKILGNCRIDKSETNLIDNQKNKKNFLNELNFDISNVKSEKFTIALYAPTHRDHDNHINASSINKMKNYNPILLNSFLKRKKIILLVREHSLFNYENIFQKDSNEKNIINFSSKLYPNIERYFDLIDILVTDYSGIYLEYLNTTKSLVFAHFDLDEYESKRGLILPKEIIFPGYSFKSQDSFIKYLDNRFDMDKKYNDNRKFLDNLLNEVSPLGACKRTMLAIDKLIN